MEFLTDPKKVKIASFIGVFSLIIALVVGIIIAQFDPDGYNPFENYISDLGSFDHTPFPYLWDAGQILCACFLIPASFYVQKLFSTFPGNEESVKEGSKPRLILSYFCLILMCISLLGLFMTGLFSEDRGMDLHILGTYIVFGGLAITSLFFGMSITFYPSPFPRVLGIYMIILPPIACVFFFATFIMLSEWLLMFSLLAWIFPFALILLKHLNKEIALKSPTK